MVDSTTLTTSRGVDSINEGLKRGGGEGGKEGGEGGKGEGERG